MNLSHDIAVSVFVVNKRVGGGVMAAAVSLKEMWGPGDKRVVAR